MKPFFKVLGIVVVALLLGCAGFLVWASSGLDGERLRQAEVFDLPGAATPLEPDGALKVMSWNIAFGGGLSGGPTDRHPADEIRHNLDGIAAYIREQAPDIVFLQEVDRPSSRTGMMDQATYLLKNSGMAHACFVSTWRSGYVPFPLFPFSSQLGGIHSGQMVLSKYPISECRRIPLPQPEENSWWYNRFYLNRAIQHAVIIPPGSDRSIDALNIHLEAFSRKNREEQARILADYAARLTDSSRLVMAGDFNSLPPFTMKVSGFDDEETDFVGDSTIDTVRAIRGLREVFIDDGRGWSEVAFHTFPASRPTRRLDYVFYRGLKWVSGNVGRGARTSDHLPVLVEFRL